MGSVEYANERNSAATMIRGIASQTRLSERQIAVLYLAGKMDTVFNTHTGKIRPHLRRNLSGREARRRLNERHRDGSPRKRCPVCGDPYDDAWKCYCYRRRMASDHSGANPPHN